MAGTDTWVHTGQPPPPAHISPSLQRALSLSPLTYPLLPPAPQQSLGYHTRATPRHPQPPHAVQAPCDSPVWLGLSPSGFPSPHHGAGVLPLGQFVQDAQEVYAREEVPPAKLVVVSSFLRESRGRGQARDQSWDEKRLFWSEDPCPKGYSTACRQEMSASPMHLPKPPAALGAKSRSVDGARAGCWSPAASPHP